MNTFDIKHRIAKRAALELKDGAVVNLGIGIPTLVADYVPEGVRVFLHSEGGMLGVGPTPSPEELDLEIINASKQAVTETPGTAYFSSSQSFAMIRGHHVDAAVLGALQISETGDIANWSVPGEDVLGVGGAMDLVVGAKQIIVTTQHVTKDGRPKLLPACTYPLTAKGEVDVVVTEYAVFRFIDGKMVLEELAEGWTPDKLKAITPANYTVSENLTAYRA
jgi:3-oxoacid CoA-transferase B subunit